MLQMFSILEFQYVVFIIRSSSGAKFHPACHGAFITHCPFGAVRNNHLRDYRTRAFFGKASQNMFQQHYGYV